MKNLIAKLRDIMAMPLYDYFDGLKVCLNKIKIPRLIIIITAFFVTWWIYVPVHEILHALGCMLGGGEVTRLELSRLYGPAFLKKIFPFIYSGSEYAGQLTDFNTNNSDITYLLTVFFPYFLTILIGIPLLRSVVNNTSSSNISCIKFGIALPIAYSPFISFTGDYYEIGSIIVTRFVFFLSPTLEIERWRSDDLFKLSKKLFYAQDIISTGDIAGVALSFLLGIALVFVTYWTGRQWSKIVNR